MRAEIPVQIGRGPLRVGAFATVVLALLAVSNIEGKEIGPDDDLCRAINDPAAGYEVVLRAGEYSGPCMIRRGGAADRPLVIRAKNGTERPHIRYDGNSANVIEVRAEHVVIMGLAFGPTERNVDGVRIRASKNVSVIDCEFVKMGGIAIVANQASLQGLLVSRNSISLSNATAMYFGCHDGNTCRLSDMIIEKNRIAGVIAAANEVGYGIQVKLNSSAIIRDNVVRNTKGPGIMVYGSADSSVESVIQRNVISGSRTSSGIVVGGGPALVINNIAFGNALAGISLQDYSHRGLLRQIKIGFNTLLENGQGAIIATPDRVSESLMVGNVGSARAADSLFPPRQRGLSSSDNVVCDRLCFADFDGLDLSPATNSVLDRRVVELNDAWLPREDFFGRRRKSPPKIGAVETAGTALGTWIGH